MKCVCGHEFTPGELVHEIYGDAPQKLCEECYIFFNTMGASHISWVPIVDIVSIHMFR